MGQIMHTHSQNVLGFVAPPGRDLARFATSKAILAIHASGGQFKDIAAKVGVTADAVGMWVAESSTAKFDAVARICYFWPEQSEPIRNVLMPAPSTPTTADRIDRIERELNAIRREVAA